MAKPDRCHFQKTSEPNSVAVVFNEWKHVKQRKPLHAMEAFHATNTATNRRRRQCSHATEWVT